MKNHHVIYLPSLVLLTTLFTCIYQIEGFISRPSLSTKSFCINTPSSLQSDTTSTTTIQSNDNSERQSLLKEILQNARSNGPIGIDASESSQSEIVDIADKIKTHSISSPASFQLRGTHSLLYSLAHSVSEDGKKKATASSGKLGRFVGKVTQEFPNDKEFRNVVQFLRGFIKIVLSARRKILDDERIRVDFESMAFSIGGVQLMKRKINGGGIWKVLFVGEFEEDDGKTTLVRLMETPSLFVIAQNIDK